MADFSGIKSFFLSKKKTFFLHLLPEITETNKGHHKASTTKHACRRNLRIAGGTWL
jgi:hypothetical protein